MEMIPKVGLGQIRFGMTPAEVRSKFPEKEVYEEWMGGNLNDSLLYRGLLLMFDKEDAHGPLKDSRLTDIIVQGRNDIQLWGRGLLEWTKGDFIDHLDQNQIPYAWYGPRLHVIPDAISGTFTDSGRLKHLEASVHELRDPRETG